MRTLISPTYVVWYNSTASSKHASSTRCEIDAVKWSTDVVETRHIEVFATFEMAYSFIQSVFIQTLKQLWDSNHDSSVAMTQLFMCAMNHFDWLHNFGNMIPNPKGNLFLLNCLFWLYIVYYFGCTLYTILENLYKLLHVHHWNLSSKANKESGCWSPRASLQTRTPARWHLNVFVCYETMSNCSKTLLDRLALWRAVF